MSIRQGATESGAVDLPRRRSLAATEFGGDWRRDLARLSLRSIKGSESMTDPAPPPFHLAFPIHDLSLARQFYGGLLGCAEGRSADDWVDFNFFGHQIGAHLAPAEVGAAATNTVDGHPVPTRHFGVVLDMDAWRALAERLTAAGVDFDIAPHIRFKGETGEQATMFFRDASGNAIELKAFADLAALFAK
jgi:extradiol dioxygenase family protein